MLYINPNPNPNPSPPTSASTTPGNHVISSAPRHNKNSIHLVSSSPVHSSAFDIAASTTHCRSITNSSGISVADISDSDSGGGDSLAAAYPYHSRNPSPSASAFPSTMNTFPISHGPSIDLDSEIFDDAPVRQPGSNSLKDLADFLSKTGPEDFLPPPNFKDTTSHKESTDPMYKRVWKGLKKTQSRDDVRLLHASSSPNTSNKKLSSHHQQQMSAMSSEKRKFVMLPVRYGDLNQVKSNHSQATGNQQRHPPSSLTSISSSTPSSNASNASNSSANSRSNTNSKASIMHSNHGSLHPSKPEAIPHNFSTVSTTTLSKNLIDSNTYRDSVGTVTSTSTAASISSSSGIKRLEELVRRSAVLEPVSQRLSIHSDNSVTHQPASHYGEPILDPQLNHLHPCFSSTLSNPSCEMEYDVNNSTILPQPVPISQRKANSSPSIGISPNASNFDPAAIQTDQEALQMSLDQSSVSNLTRKVRHVQIQAGSRAIPAGKVYSKDVQTDIISHVMLGTSLSDENGGGGLLQILQSQNSSLQANVSTLNTEVTTLQGENADLHARLQHYESELKTARQSNAQVHDQFNQLKAQYTDLVNQHGATTLNAEVLKTESNTHRSHVDYLEKQHSHQKLQIQSLQLALDAERSQHNVQSEEFERLSRAAYAKMKQLILERIDLVNEIDVWRAKLRDANQRMTDHQVDELLGPEFHHSIKSSGSGGSSSTSVAMMHRFPSTTQLASVVQPNSNPAVSVQSVIGMAGPHPSVQLRSPYHLQQQAAPHSSLQYASINHALNSNPVSVVNSSPPPILKPTTSFQPSSEISMATSSGSTLSQLGLPPSSSPKKLYLSSFK